MNGKPQEARTDEQEDLLEQIITRGLDKLKAPDQETAELEPPPETAPRKPMQEGGGEAASPADRKNKRSAVYLYLLVLFGAAFMLLLLAYFIQRRSNESAISDLRDSMNLSRQELLTQIRDLEEQNTVLTGDNEALAELSAQWRRRYEEKSREADELLEQYFTAQETLYAWDSFWMLEDYYQLGNYEACAAVLLLQLQGQYTYRTPDAARARQEEIVRAVVDAGILDEEYAQHPEDYQFLLTAYSQP